MTQSEYEEACRQIDHVILRMEEEHVRPATEAALVKDPASHDFTPNLAHDWDTWAEVNGWDLDKKLLEDECVDCDEDIQPRWQYCPHCGREVNEFTLRAAIAVLVAEATKKHIAACRKHAGLA